MKVTKSLIASCFLGFALLAPLASRAATREMPLPIRTVSPDYPQEMRAQKVSGLVMIKVQVDEKGDVNEAVVVKSTNNAFDGPALEALKRWKFKPATEDGKAVAIAITVPVKFNAEDAG